MPFCPKCGRQVTEDARFCYSCGYELEQVNSLSKTTSPPQHGKAFEGQQSTTTSNLKPLPSKRKNGKVGKIILTIIIIFMLLFVIGFLAEIMYAGTDGTVRSPSTTTSTRYNKMGITIKDFKPQQDKDNKTYYTMDIYDGEAKIVTVKISTINKFGNKQCSFSVRLDVLPTTSTKVKAYGFIFYGEEEPPKIGIFTMGGVSALNYVDIKRFLTDDGKGVIYANDEFWRLESGWDYYMFIIQEPFPKDITFAVYFVIEKNGITLNDINSHITLPVPSS